MPNREGAGLYDRLMATGVVIEPVSDKIALRKETARLGEQLRQALVFDIQNVADYYHSFPKDAKIWHDTDFPKIAPPFKSFFMEFEPRKSWQQGEVQGHSIGFLCYAYDLQNHDPTPWKPDQLSLYPSARWIIESTMFVEDRKWKMRAWTRLVSAVQPNGDMVRAQSNDPRVHQNIRGAFLPAFLDGKENALSGFKDMVSGDIQLGYYPTLLALSFLHCKNVVVQTEEPNPQLSRIFQKKHGRPLVKFHVLNIEPMKTILKNEGQVEEVGLKRALHIVRGHFADYTEKGLFGKHRGIYWFDQHARGSIEQGVVLKDYSVDKPK